MTISQRLIEAIEKSGETHYRIGTDTGIGPDQVTRFVAGRDIRISTAEKLAEYFNLELTAKKTKDKRNRK